MKKEFLLQAVVCGINRIPNGPPFLVLGTHNYVVDWKMFWLFGAQID